MICVFIMWLHLYPWLTLTKNPHLSLTTYPDLPGRLWTSSEMQCETAWGAGSGPAQLGSCWGSSYHLSFDLWSFQWVNLGPVGCLISGRSKDINVSRNETSKSFFGQGMTGTGTWGQASLLCNRAAICCTCKKMGYQGRVVAKRLHKWASTQALSGNSQLLFWCYLQIVSF